MMEEGRRQGRGVAQRGGDGEHGVGTRKQRRQVGGEAGGGPVWMGSGPEAGEWREKMNRRKVTANVNQPHCVALSLPFSACPPVPFPPLGLVGDSPVQGASGGSELAL